MGRMAKGVPGFTDRDKEEALEIIRRHPQMTIAELERKMGNRIPGTTLARWRREIQNETGSMGQENTSSGSGEEKPQKMSEKQRMQALEQENADLLRRLNVKNIQFAYSRKYASMQDDADRKEIEIQYLMALLREYGCKDPERLSMEEEPTQSE
jgi:transposase-like protein